MLGNVTVATVYKYAFLFLLSSAIFILHNTLNTHSYFVLVIHITSSSTYYFVHTKLRSVGEDFARLLSTDA